MANFDEFGKAPDQLTARHLLYNLTVVCAAAIAIVCHIAAQNKHFLAIIAHDPVKSVPASPRQQVRSDHISVVFLDQFFGNVC